MSMTMTVVLALCKVGRCLMSLSVEHSDVFHSCNLIFHKKILFDSFYPLNEY